MSSSHLLVSHNYPPPMDIAIIIRVPATLGIDIELDHPPRIFSALICLALLAGAECHASDRGDGRERQ